MENRCDGWTRKGGAFTFGPVKWEQCENQATVLLTVTQESETKTLAACATCWQTAIDNSKIEVLEAKPII